jgi:uncharacterized delta-60 repeat protein
MKTLHRTKTHVLAGSLLLQLSTLCFHAHAAPGDVDLSFDPGSGVNGTVNAMALQPDGKIIIAGEFTTVKGLVRTNLARLNADGSGDSSFTAATYSGVTALVLQPDGKVLIANGSLARLHSDGSRDTNFNPNLCFESSCAEVYSIALQSDGKVLAAYDGVFRFNSDGTLDSNFVSQADGNIDSMALQPDGKLIVGGYLYEPTNNSSRYSLVRLNANGDRDTSFDGSAAADGFYSAIVVQLDEKVLVAGAFIRSGSSNVTSITRLNANGTADSTFNIVTGTGGVTFPWPVYAVALQADGKMIIGGQFVSINGYPRTNIARLNVDGSVDVNFQNAGGGASGQSLPWPGALVKAIALQTNGAVFIGGVFTTVDGTNRSRVARLNTNGGLDAAFHSGGGIDYPVSRVISSDGKVLIGGDLTFINGTNRYASARLNANGSLDSSFISASFHPDLPSVIFGPKDYSATNVLAVQSDGKTLVLWTLTRYICDTSGENCDYYGSYLFSRFNPDGSRDTNFASNIGVNGAVNSVAIQSDGKLLVGGNFSVVNGTNRPGIARLNPDGSLDNSFNPAAGTSGVTSIALQPDGRVLIGVASYLVNGTNRFGVARLNANGTLDSTFNPGTGAFSVLAIALQWNGKVLIGGDFTSFNGTNRNRIARLNADGSLDSSFNPGTGANAIVRSIALQPDGNALIGGDFTLVNGVERPRVARLYGDFVAPLPSLSIARLNASMNLSWPTNALNFQLQESTNPALPAAWVLATQSRVTNGARISVTVPASAQQKFFRLKSQ